MGKHFESVKGHIRAAKVRSSDFKNMMDRATKLRFSPEDMAKKIKYGMPGTKGLIGNKRFASLSEAGQRHALDIVDQECAKQAEWAPKQLPRLAKSIESRLKVECA